LPGGDRSVEERVADDEGEFDVVVGPEAANVGGKDR